MEIQDSSGAILGCILFFAFLFIVGGLVGSSINECNFQKSVCLIVSNNQLSEYNKCCAEKREQILLRIKNNNK